MTANARAALAVVAGMLIVLFAALASGQMGRDGRIAPPRPVPDDEIAALLGPAQVQIARQYRGLAVFPVVVEGVPHIGRLTTMEEAVRQGTLTISEFNGGNVNRVWMDNRSRGTIFGMAGEAVQGGRQDRMMRDDVLIPPQSKLAVPVYCVEQERWTGKTDEFAHAGIAAQPSLRSTARASDSQEKVWEANEANQRRLSVASETKALGDVYASEPVKAEMAGYLDALGDLPDEIANMCGVVVAIRGKIVCADVFGDPDLLRRLWPKLLRSYVADDLAAATAKPPTGDRQAAERFLKSAIDARRTDRDHVGAGRSLTLRGDRVGGAALLYGEGVVHLEVFPSAAKPGPQPVPMPRPE
jgi:hypothetical protein